MSEMGQRVEHEVIHIFHHFDAPVTINLNVTHLQDPLRRATSAKLTMEDGTMAGKITVDQGGKVKISFADDKGDTDAQPPAGNGSGPVTYTFTSDDEAVATVAQDPSNPLEGDVTGVDEGNANIGATIANADGSPVTEPDGVTPFTVNPVAVTVDAGLAVSASLAQE